MIGQTGQLARHASERSHGAPAAAPRKQVTVVPPPAAASGGSRTPADDFPAHLKAVRQLGRGAYGTVHLCEDTRCNTTVAVKHIKNAARHGKSILREIRLLARLKHENLLHLLDFAAVSGKNFQDVFLVLPYMPADLHKVIQSQQSLTEKHVQVIMVQIFRALAYLHAANVAHRDLKPANILLFADCKLRICDFGLARGDMGGIDKADDDDENQFCGVLTEYVVTRWYRAPEVMLLPKKYTFAVDTWSIGCILAEILGRKAILPGKNHVDMICRMSQIIGAPHDSELEWLPKDSDAYRFLRRFCRPEKSVPLDSLYPRASPACLDLVRALLRWNPVQRLSASDAQEHKYLAAYLPKEAPIPPEPFDWSFDDFKPSSEAVRERLYKECIRFHPEILERDMVRAPRGSGVPLPPSEGYPAPTSSVTSNSSGRPQTLLSAPQPVSQRFAGNARESTPPARRPTPRSSQCGNAPRQQESSHGYPINHVEASQNLADKRQESLTGKKQESCHSYVTKHQEPIPVSRLAPWGMRQCGLVRAA